MPFEVYPVSPMHDGYQALRDRNSVASRTPSEVADEIRRHYENVAEKGGQIIASHTVNYSSDSIGESGDFTFLVAEFPEAKALNS